MLKFFIKISLLLFSLWIHDSKVLAGDTFTAVCLREFQIVDGKGVCLQAYPDQHEYSCDVKSCYDGASSNHYVQMKDCTHNGSNDKGRSTQDCAQYKSMLQAGFSCTNTNGFHYTCPFRENTFQKLTCSSCTK
ncbi:uncharacterized protein MELLADRAFT_123586 [Melampsora larici-populina 98AG31]|uniref:Secreted protein n=1 Tax=Melampsora larici-populina (strain 98AG31 / pathotype 3-4-7) TaxID=747676 RepID=F4R5E9_MELLP|nr:uncharacterized protein MELLADRAFT_123586 [Melampsora larici-populina 98AG31]EGG12032.1 secreted protein [Melampsora larici-populina 98AG31]